MTEVRLNDILPLVLDTENASGNAIDTDAQPVVVLRRNGATVSPAITHSNPAVGVRNIAVSIAPAQSWAAGDRGDGYVEYALGGVAQRRGFSFLVRDSVATETANALLSTPTNKLATDSTGRTLLQPAQPGVTIPTVSILTGHTPQTGDTFARIGPNGSGLTGVALSATAIQSIWDFLTSGFAVVGSIGKRIADNLDASIGSRLATTGYTAPIVPPTPAQIRQELDANSTKLANLDATISSRSTFAGGAVASVAGAVGSVNSPVTVGTNTDKSGYALTATDKENIATRVESHLLDEGDSQMLINAIVGAIGNTNINQMALVAALRSDLERSGGTLATILADYARRTGDYATPTNVTALGTQIGNLNNLSQLQAQNAATLALADYDSPTRAEATSDKDEIIAALPTQIGGSPVLPPSGSVLFNPRFLNSSGTGIPLALVEIYQGADRIGTGTTNANGRVEFAAGEGFVILKNVAYSLRVYAQGFQSRAPIAFSLSADAAPSYSLAALPPVPVSADPQKAVVRVRTADFSGVPLQNETVTLTLDDQRPIAIGDKLISTRFVKGQTNELGEVDLEVWSDETLETAGLKPTYDLKMTGVVGFSIRVPPEGGIASELKAVA